MRQHHVVDDTQINTASFADRAVKLKYQSEQWFMISRERILITR